MVPAESEAREPVQFLAPSAFAAERVFPIRNLVLSTDAAGAIAHALASNANSSARSELETATASTTVSSDDADRGVVGDGMGVGGGLGVGLEDAGGIEVDGEQGSKVDTSIASIPASKDQKIASSSPPSSYLPPPYPPTPPNEAIRKLPELQSAEADERGKDDGQERYTSERTQMVPSKFSTSSPGTLSGQGPNGERPLFEHCEDEPIHIPGAIQKFGALVGIRCKPEGVFEVRICSENTMHILGRSPESLFNLSSFSEILDEESREELSTRVANAVQCPSLRNEDTHLDVFSVTVKSSNHSPFQLWCAVHLPQDPGDIVILEFEVYSDALYLKGPEGTSTLSKKPVSENDMEITPEEREKSTTSKSKPLRVLQIAKRKGQKTFTSMDIFNAMTQAQEQLVASQSLQGLFDVVVGLVSELTGFHRVMFYRFDEMKNGSVEAELVDDRASSEIFRGTVLLSLLQLATYLTLFQAFITQLQIFPVWFSIARISLPNTHYYIEQARELYKINRIRLLHDRDGETARLVCRDETDFVKPLDLTHSYLRAMSPIHLKYLGNMGVRSSMSISIVINSDLWGLIACHQYGDTGLRVSLPIRELCRNIGECAASNIERLVMLQRLEARRAPQTAPPAQSPQGFIAASSSDLLRAFDADFGMLSIQDEARAIGRLDPYREALVILAHLQGLRLRTIVCSQNVNADFPTINYPPGIEVISGLLLIPLSMGGNDFMVFFRKGQLKEVRWAGNPYEKIVQPGTQHFLQPRTSFARWTESVIGKSKAWTDDQLDTATVLSLLYGRFIEIWRQKESASQNSRLTRLLIRNSSHEVRTPLNAIVNYLEMALETDIDGTTRDLLEKAHRASRSLIYVIDDLLNLTKAEDGPVSRVGNAFDLGATVSDVITAFRKEAIRKGLDLTVSTHQGIPAMVKGDPSRLRQVLSNITSNAFQHSVNGGIKVEICPIRNTESSSVVAISVQDVGLGMSETQLDDLFQEFEQIVDEDERSLSYDNTPQSIDGGSVPSLGVGLAVVARYVRNMNGQIRVSSELGKGTIFGIELPFEHAQTGDFRTAAGLAKKYLLPRVASFDSNSSIPNSPIPKEDAVNKESEPQSKPSEESLKHRPLRTLSYDPEVNEKVKKPITASRQDQQNLDGADGSNCNPSLSVLIAEDNPINARLLSKRLLKLGHEVEVAYDGQECFDYFASRIRKVDVILMDIQMPLVDGAQSVKMIRRLEAELKNTPNSRPRVPVIAVSASLTEDNRFEYLQSGFDAWVLKPVNFSRLELLLKGIKDQEVREQALYVPGYWERGGWFMA
ncbi:hypothetical protein HYFRA_00004938 [Hymenoscyphus fraxineus]|uniref:Uncharacterized protein n=1 Tax=Hymenoscyphus fraxineus TaxID=746836 RepID=A0A9N9PPC8_9HELO|nr:hypothetical protein HYFRA_00004938 [Hymenoscyphus fraxineus]